MSLEDQYDAWVRGLMGGGKYAATPKQAEDANDAVQQMQAQLDALTEAQKRQTAADSALNAVQKAGAATAESVRRMSSELTKSLKQDGLLGGTVAAPSPAPVVPAKADFAGVTEKIKAQVLGQDAFVSALVKAFRRPFVLGTADDTAHARSGSPCRTRVNSCSIVATSYRFQKAASTASTAMHPIMAGEAKMREAVLLLR